MPVWWCGVMVDMPRHTMSIGPPLVLKQQSVVTGVRMASVRSSMLPEGRDCTTISPWYTLKILFHIANPIFATKTYVSQLKQAVSAFEGFFDVRGCLGKVGCITVDWPAEPAAPPNVLREVVTWTALWIAVSC